MNPDLYRMLPAITAIFGDAGYSTNISEDLGAIKITVAKGEFSETKTFPFPSTNRDLSVPLLAWKVQLISNESAV